MSQRDRDELPAGIDEIAEAYRSAGFDDLPPKRVDESVLAAARRQDRRRARDYLPAFAAAATIVLAVALVLRLTIPGAGPRLDESIEEFAPATERLRAPASADTAAQATAGVESTANPSEPGVRSGVAADATESDAPAPATLLEAAQDSDDTAACSASQRSEAALWIECISALVEREAIPQAREELAEFSRRFPDDPLPEELAGL